MSAIWAPVVLAGVAALVLVLASARRSSGRMTLTYRLDVKLSERTPPHPLADDLGDADADADADAS